MKLAVPFLMLVLFLLAPLSVAVGQEKPRVEVVRLTIHPAEAPRPALEIQLLPPFLDRRPGNAALLYMKSFLLLAMTKTSDETFDKMISWFETPPELLPQEKMRKVLGGPFRDTVHYAELAARRARCDWEMPFREEENIFGILLPELSSARNIARVIALRARLHIAEGNYDEAFHDLQTGYAMARHMADQPTLVSGLVALAIADVMTDQVQLVIQGPKVPSLYWTITALPDPLIDLRKALELEAVGVYLLFPEFEQAIWRGYTPERWKALLADLFEKVQAFSGQAEGDQQPKRINIEQFIGKTYPIARRELVEHSRLDPDIDDMPPASVVVIHVLEVFEALRDDMFKWFYVPYWQAREGIEQAVKELETAGPEREVVPLASSLLPAVGICHLRISEMQRRLAALRCVEAIRLFAATYDGKLPKSLNEIKQVPIPINPVTGKSFGYRVEGDTAVLQADGPSERPGRMYRLELVQ